MEVLDGYTIEQWKVKYQLAEKRAKDSAQLAGSRMSEIRQWSEMAERICVSCGIEWPEHQGFATVVIQAFRELQAGKESSNEST